MRKTIEYIKRNYDKIVLIVGIILSLIIRYLCRNYESADFNGCLKGWVATFLTHDRWRALKDNVGNYNVVYQYILILLSYIPAYCLYTIKIVSILFDFITAFGCARCLKVLGADAKKQNLCFTIILLLPTVWLNSSFWAQCDSIYACFIVWSLYCLLKQKNYYALIFLALAFTFKLQAVFVMPVYFIFFIKKKIKFRELFAFPITYFITCIPAMFFEKSFLDICSIYWQQTKEYPYMVMNAPSLLGLFEIIQYNSILEKICIFAVVAVVCCISFKYWRKKEEITQNETVSLFMLFAVIVPFLLPHMHDRYFYIADIISILYVFTFGVKRCYIALLMQSASLICYLQYFGYINLYGGKYSAYFFNGVIGATLVFLIVIYMYLLHYYSFFSKEKRLHQKQHFIIVLFVVILILGVAKNCFNRERIEIKVDGKLVNCFGIYPYEKDDVIMMPLRNVFNAYGYKVDYDYNEHYVKVSNDENKMIFRTDSTTARKNDMDIEMEIPISSINSTNYISVADFCKIADLTFHKKARTLCFYTKE